MSGSSRRRWYAGTLGLLLGLGCLARCASVAPRPAGVGSAASDARKACEGLDALEPLEASNRWAQLERLDCLLDGGELASAAALVGEMGDRFGDERELMKALSDRLTRLIQTHGQLSDLPARLRLEDSSLPVPTVQASVAGRQGLLIWDSGSESSALDRALCSRLGLQRIGRGEVVDSTRQVEEGNYIALLSEPIDLGSVRMDLPTVFCIDLGHVVAQEPRFIGILGANALNISAYQINLARKELTLGAVSSGAFVTLDATFQNGLPRVRGEVDGRGVDFLLDTGADFSVLSNSTIEALGLEARASGESRTTQEAGGQREESDLRVLLPQLDLGNEVRASMEMRTGGTDILGLDFIGNRTLFVDRERGVVGLSPIP